MKLDWKKIKRSDWFAIGMIVGMVVFYTLPMLLEFETGNAEFRMEINAGLLAQARELEKTVAQYELQVAFYEHVLALDVVECKEKARDARIAFNKMVGVKISEEAEDE